MYGGLLQAGLVDADHHRVEHEKPPVKVLVHLIPAKREALNEAWFLSLADARRIIDAWRQDYNTVRPHSAVGYRTPEAFEQRGPNGECGTRGLLPVLALAPRRRPDAVSAVPAREPAPGEVLSGMRSPSRPDMRPMRH